MSDNFFLDTNIFAYSFDGTSLSKQKRSRELISRALSTGKGMISYQVLQEFVNFALKSKVAPMTLEQVRRYCLKVLRPLCAIHSSSALYSRALTLKENTQYSWYDSLIVGAALEANCEVLYSEDLQHGRVIEGMRIENPFGK